MWYGFGRGIIEGLRTDSLYLGSTDIRISQVVGFASFALGALFLLFLYVTKKYRQIPALCLDHPGLEPREQPEAIEPQADLEKPEAQEDGQEPKDRES